MKRNERILTRKRHAQALRRQGTRRGQWWCVVDEKERRQSRSMRAKASRAASKHAARSTYQIWAKAERWKHRRLMQFKADQHASGRRAILVHPDGSLSPMKMLAFTNHPSGVIGSFLGGSPVALAFNKHKNVVLMGLQDEICDEEWGADAYALLKSLRLHKTVRKIYGRALCSRLCMHETGRIMLGDLPLTCFATGQCAMVKYSYQKEAEPEGDCELGGDAAHSSDSASPASDESVSSV